MRSFTLTSTEKALLIAIRREFERTVREATIQESQGYAPIFAAHGVKSVPSTVQVDLGKGTISWDDSPSAPPKPAIVRNNDSPNKKKKEV